VENKDSSFKEALQNLRKICSKQEKCPADLLGLLKRWGVNRDQHQDILEKLRAEGFLNEHRYATAFVRDKMKFEHWGIIKIRYNLRQKGIAQSVCDQAIAAIDHDEYRVMVGRELGKKRRSLQGTSREIWAKLARYGASRGYEMDVMQEFLRHDGPED
jgi:regulatory protein